MKYYISLFFKTSVFLLFLNTTVFCQNRDDINNRDILYLTSGGKLNPLQAIMDIRHYTIALDVDIQKQYIAGFTEISLNLSQKTDTLLFDLIHLYKVSSIKVNGAKSSFFQKNDKIFITSQSGFGAGKHIVKIDYSGIPPVAIKPPWDGGFTWGLLNNL